MAKRLHRLRPGDQTGCDREKSEGEMGPVDPVCKAEQERRSRQESAARPVEDQVQGHRQDAKEAEFVNSDHAVEDGPQAEDDREPLGRRHIRVAQHPGARQQGQSPEIINDAVKLGGDKPHSRAPWPEPERQRRG